MFRIASIVLTLGAIALMIAWVVYGGIQNLLLIATGVSLYLADRAAAHAITSRSPDSRETPPESETTMEVRVREPGDPA